MMEGSQLMGSGIDMDLSNCIQGLKKVAVANRIPKHNKNLAYNQNSSFDENIL